MGTEASERAPGVEGEHRVQGAERVRTVVIGAGQAGLSSAYHLMRRGLVPHEDFVVLDGNPAAGGAWLHRWPSLTFGSAHALHDLPGLPLGTPDPLEPASDVVNRYYGEYERAFDLRVLRPVRVTRIESSAEDSHLHVVTGAGTWVTDVVISATGTWDRPYWPYYPGREVFAGRQLHTHDYRSAAEFAGQRVLVVGGGTSAVQFVLQLQDAGALPVWSTRRPPAFTRRPFDPEWGRQVESDVDARTRAGLPPESVVSVTGLPLTEEYERGIDAGVLVSRGPLAELRERSAVFADGSEEPTDVILWATGFRAALDHLTGLRLREPGGGIIMDGVHVVKEPRLLLVGYGASASTLGATRAGRAAAVAALAKVRALPGTHMPTGTLT